MKVGCFYKVLNGFYESNSDGNSFLANYGEHDYRLCYCLSVTDWNDAIGWLVPSDLSNWSESSTPFDVQITFNDKPAVLHLDYTFVCNDSFTMGGGAYRTEENKEIKLDDRDQDRVKSKYVRLESDINELRKINNNRLMDVCIKKSVINKWGLEEYRKGFDKGYSLRTMYDGYEIKRDQNFGGLCVYSLEGFGNLKTNELAARQAANEGIPIMWLIPDWMIAHDLTPIYPLNNDYNYVLFNKMKQKYEQDQSKENDNTLS